MRFLPLLFALAACGASVTEPLHVDFVGEDADAIEKALRPTIEAVNTELGCRGIIIEHSGYQGSYATISSDYDIVKSHGDDTAGWYSPGPWGGLIYLLPLSTYDGHRLGKTPDEHGPWFGQQTVELVLIHELGHAMGLGHEEDTIMQAKLKELRPREDAAKDLVRLLEKHWVRPCR